MISVKRPSGDVIAEKLIEVPSPDLVRKYENALLEISKLQQAASNANQRTQIKQVMVEKIVDSPELLATVENLKGQIVALENARLNLQRNLRAEQEKPKTTVTDIREVERIVEKEVVKLATNWKLLLIAASVGMGLMFAVLKVIH